MKLTPSRRFEITPRLLLFITAALILSAAPLFGQNSPRRPAGMPTFPTPNRSGAPNKVPTPSALPSQRLASPAVKKSKSPTSCLLQSTRRVGSTDMVAVAMKGAGTVRPSASGDDGLSAGGAMEVEAGFQYEERIEEYRTTPGNISLASIRQYEQAGMKRQYGGETTRLLLESSRKYIASRFNGKTLTNYSPSGPLKNDQFLLIDELPANTLLLDQLLPNREVKLGDEWTISDETLRALLGLEAIENNTARLVLTAIIDDMAEVDLFLGDGGKDDKGNPLPSTIQGASLGSTVEIDLQGKYQFDLKARRLTWFGMTITEKRSESLVEPGLDWEATVRIRIAPLAKPNRLTDDLVATLRTEPNAKLFELAYSGQKGAWSFQQNRSWRMTEDGEKSAALVFLSKGEGIAQCNILSNGKIELDSMPTMEAYKKELEKGLGPRFGRFVQESEYIDDFGCKVMAVMIDGQFEEVPFRWLYYLITEERGWQTTIMFEIRGDKIEEYGDSGREIVDSFKMILPVEETKILSTEDPEPEEEESGLTFEKAPLQTAPPAKKPEESPVAPPTEKPTEKPAE